MSMPAEVGPPRTGNWPFDPKMTELPTATRAATACTAWGLSNYGHL
jgi:hypothetical protein